MAAANAKSLLRDLVEGLFTRKTGQGDKTMVMSALAGDIDLPHGCGRYRILGMRPVRDEKISHDYDVLRIWTKEDGLFPREGRTAVMKISQGVQSDDEFLQECRLLIALSDEYPNWRQRRHFMEVLGVGSLENFCFHGKRGDEEYTKVSVARPFYITERLPITLEDVRFLSRNRFVDPQLAIYLAIGMLKGLRLLHEMGWVMREVAPSRFSLRLPHSAMIYRYISEISDRVAITNLGWATRFRCDKRTKVADNVAYNLRYSSPDVMQGISQTPRDDVYSVFFILLEFLLGFIPWEGKTREEIITAKQNAMAGKQVKEDGKLLFNDFCDLFTTVAESDAELGMIPYEKLCELLIRQTNNRKPDLSIIGCLYYHRRHYRNATEGNRPGDKKSKDNRTNATKD